MNSKILNALGIPGVDPMIFVFIFMAIILIMVLALVLTNSKIKKLNEKYDKFMQGKDMESMEDIVMKRFDQIDEMLRETEKNTLDIQNIFDSMKKTVQKVGVVKYDAFNEMGGKLSFALAMLDGNNCGFVINAMHSREGCYTYIKEIINGESYIPLGNEEKEALNQAMEKLEEIE